MQTNSRGSVYLRDLHQQFNLFFGTFPDAFFSVEGLIPMYGTACQSSASEPPASNYPAAAVRVNNTRIVSVKADGVPLLELDLNHLHLSSSADEPVLSLIRSVASEYLSRGAQLSGCSIFAAPAHLFNCSSRSPELLLLLICRIFNVLFFNNTLSDSDIGNICRSVVGGEILP